MAFVPHFAAGDSLCDAVDLRKAHNTKSHAAAQKMQNFQKQNLLPMKNISIPICFEKFRFEVRLSNAVLEENIFGTNFFSFFEISKMVNIGVINSN